MVADWSWTGVGGACTLRWLWSSINRCALSARVNGKHASDSKGIGFYEEILRWQDSRWRRGTGMLRVGNSVMRVLIIEDDEKTAQAIASGLEAAGFSASVSHTGEEGFFQLNAEVFDLVVLDWMLPGRDGIEILKTIRARGSKTPVLLLTARDAVEDRVLGLESGADDYLVKPFAFAELLARIRSLLRRASPAEALKRTVADLMVDLEARRVSRAGKPVELTPREFDLLAYLVRQPGQVVTREMLGRDVWGETNRITPLDNVIDVHIAHLRRKVDEGHTIKLVQTVRGVGFVLREEGRA
jgi:two-component system, OmpR family, copper resistance phosphate regulon response regulator CusR